MRKTALALAILGILILAVALVSWAALPAWRGTTGGFWLLLAAAAAGVITLVKGVLDILKTWRELGGEKKEKPTPVQGEVKVEVPATPPPPVPDDREALQRALTMTRRSLAILEEQAAGYTALTIPVHLKIDLEEQRPKVAELEARLKELEE